MNEVMAGAIYEGKPRKQFRLLAKHVGNLVPVVWFSVGEDGSLYIGPYVPNANGAKSGSVSPGADGTVTVSYEDGQEFRDAASDATKVSFHTSGVVHYDQKRAFIQALPSRDPRGPICHMIFPKPKAAHYLASAQVRPARDIVTPFEITDEAPFAVVVFYSPGGQAVLREIASNEWKSFVHYPALGKVGSAILELTIYSTPSEHWPPHAYILMQADPDPAGGKLAS